MNWLSSLVYAIAYHFFPKKFFDYNAGHKAALKKAADILWEYRNEINEFSKIDPRLKVLSEHAKAVSDARDLIAKEMLRAHPWRA